MLVLLCFLTEFFNLSFCMSSSKEKFDIHAYNTIYIFPFSVFYKIGLFFLKCTKKANYLFYSRTGYNVHTLCVILYNNTCFVRYS